MKNTFWHCDTSKFKNFNTKSNCHLKYEALSSEYNYFQYMLTWLDLSKNTYEVVISRMKEFHPQQLHPPSTYFICVLTL
jgi:hypothetical protein